MQNQVSRPLLGVLAAVAVFAILYFTVLKGSSSSSSSSVPVATPVPPPPTTTVTTATTTTPKPKPKPKPTPKPKATARPTTPTSRLAAVTSALQHKRVVAVLFYGGAASDAIVKSELGAILARPDVFKLAVPVAEVANYGVLSTPVPIGNGGPTLVIVDRRGHASTITGFADGTEIRQRINQALAT